MTTGMTSESIRLLPFQVRPRAGEGIRSFIARLAHANHLKPASLLTFLREPADRRGLPSWSRLAAVTNRDPDALRLTLETRHCLECGSAMPPADVLGRRALHCSQACRRIARRKRVPLSPPRKEPCLICGTTTKSQLGQRRLLCSSACRRTAYLKRQLQSTHADP
ncbi:TniQ family protein [Streptomyces chrestomyceticus]|uniref:TniQ family protein n=1 Tax=Streptomyces chrestomyceticus TaxID=68185 RepID=UPI0039DF3DB5